MSERTNMATTAEVGLKAVDRSVLAGYISAFERLAGNAEAEVSRLEILVSGLTAEDSKSSPGLDKSHPVGLAGLADAQDRMEHSHNALSNLIDQMNSLVAL